MSKVAPVAVYDSEPKAFSASGSIASEPLSGEANEAAELNFWKLENNHAITEEDIIKLSETFRKEGANLCLSVSYWHDDKNVTKGLMDLVAQSTMPARRICRVVLLSCVHPLHAAISLSLAFRKLVLLADGKRLANVAASNASELEQLACAIVRKSRASMNWLKSGPEIDDCLQLAATADMASFVSDTVCTIRIRDLWNGAQISSVFYSRDIAQRQEKVYIFEPSPFTSFYFSRIFYLGFLVLLSTTALEPLVDHYDSNLNATVTPNQTMSRNATANVSTGLDEYTDDPDSIGIGNFILYALFDIVMAEIFEILDINKKFKNLGFWKCFRVYIQDGWNKMDSFSLLVAIVAAFIRFFALKGYFACKTDYEDACIDADYSNTWTAWAILLLWLRMMSFSLLVPRIGPLLHIVTSAIKGIIPTFVILALMITMPFAVALNFLETDNEDFSTVGASLLSFFKIYIGNPMKIQSEKDEYIIKHASSTIIIAVGSVLISIMLLNLLIAMFTQTFDQVDAKANQIHMLQRAQMTFVWMHVKAPPPFCFVFELLSKLNKISFSWKKLMPPPEFSRPEFLRLLFSCSEGFDEFETDLQNKQDSAALSQKMQSQNQELGKLFQQHWPEGNIPNYESWCEEVLADLEENGDREPETQIEKFNSSLLGKVDRMQDQIEELKLLIQRPGTNLHMAQTGIPHP
jgi:hypothetical protein